MVFGLKWELSESDDYPLSRLPLWVQPCLVWLVLVTLWTIFVELVVFQEYMLRGWIGSYLPRWRCVTIVNVFVSIALIACFVLPLSTESLTIVTSWAFSLRLLK